MDGGGGALAFSNLLITTLSLQQQLRIYALSPLYILII